jgi:transposase
VAIGRKNYLFAGSDAGGRRAAAIYSLIESAKLNALNPQRYIADVLARIADHPARRIAELLPWNWQPLDATRAAAWGDPRLSLSPGLAGALAAANLACSRSCSKKRRRWAVAPSIPTGSFGSARTI